MTESTKSNFEYLKEKVTSRFLETHSAPDKMDDWSVADIQNFQEDLLQKVNSRISEKWFYTYFKKSPEKLPRIDMLNFLSVYAGFENWQQLKSSRENVTGQRSNTISYFKIAIPITAIVLFVFLYNNYNSERIYKFCFYDEAKKSFITDNAVEIKILKDNESPLFLRTDEMGCFRFESKDDRIVFVAKSQFYKTDTIVRSYANNNHSTIKLDTDYHALMLQFFTNGNKEDWEDYKNLLENLFADNIVAYQLYPDNIGVELYNKEKLIRKLTLPTTGLKKFQILEKTLKNGKIVNLKFMMK